MIFSLSWKLRMLTQTLPVHSLQAFTSHGGGKSSFRGRSGSGTANPKHWTGRLGGKFCRLCQAARFSRRIFTSHKVQDCSKVCLEKMSWFLTCKLILKSTQWLWFITTSGTEILGVLARWVKYLPTMKLRASRCVPGMRVSRPWGKLRLFSPPSLLQF